MLAVVILLSFFYWAEEETPVRELKNTLNYSGDPMEEYAVLTDGVSGAVGIQNAEEVSSAVFHAGLQHRISYKSAFHNLRLRLCFSVIALLGIACFSSWARYDFLTHLFQGRIVLIRFIHNSDGKK